MSPCAYPFSKTAVIWRDLTWPHKNPKFNLHHLRNISTGFEMAVLTSKSGICKGLPWYLIKQLEVKEENMFDKKVISGIA